ncbi:hypothetical protein GIB67_035998, partial [Kingdonia uniflora]
GGGLWASYHFSFLSVIFVEFSTAFCWDLVSKYHFKFQPFRVSLCWHTPNVLWGSYPAVEKGSLENYTFCLYCSKPKSPRTHHCRSCGMCILDMDHHCPFIGNCVGAANHRSFIVFLISALISTIYVSGMSAYVGFHLWPPLDYGSLNLLSSFTMHSSLIMVKQIVIAFLSSAVFLTPRSLLLVYLFVASFSMEIGLTVLLWQQLWFIYEGKTYLTHLTQGKNGVGQRDCQNISRFFGFSYSGTRFLPIFSRTKKIHRK